MSPNSRGRQPDHCDWKPLRRSPEFRDHYDDIEWETPKITLREGYRATTNGTNEQFRLVKIEEAPYCIHCDREVKLYPTPSEEHPDLYYCESCELYSAEEDGEIEWKPRK